MSVTVDLYSDRMRETDKFEPDAVVEPWEDWTLDDNPVASKARQISYGMTNFYHPVNGLPDPPVEDHRDVADVCNDEQEQYLPKKVQWKTVHTGWVEGTATTGGSIGKLINDDAYCDHFKLRDFWTKTLLDKYGPGIITDIRIWTALTMNTSPPGDQMSLGVRFHKNKELIGDQHIFYCGPGMFDAFESCEWAPDSGYMAWAEICLIPDLISYPPPNTWGLNVEQRGLDYWSADDFGLYFVVTNGVPDEGESAANWAGFKLRVTFDPLDTSGIKKARLVTPERSASIVTPRRTARIVTPQRTARRSN